MNSEMSIGVATNAGIKAARRSRARPRYCVAVTAVKH